MANEATNWVLSKKVRWTVSCALALVAAVWLWRDHRDHALSVAPYLLLLACPLMHLFGHRGHRGHNH